MTHRGRRRRVVEEDDSDSGDDQPMSPNTQRRHDQEIIMKHDLGTATADFIKTSDYKRPQVSQIDLVRKCDIPGTQEAKLSRENKEKAKGWQAYGQTDEAKQTASGDVTQGKGNVHRRATRQKLDDAARLLGHKLDLEDTYDDQKFRRPFPMAKDATHAARRLQGNQQHVAPNKPSVAVPSPAKKKTPKRERTQHAPNRSGPPPALVGLPALSNLPKLPTMKKGTPTARSASSSKSSSAQAMPSATRVTATISTAAMPGSIKHKGGIAPAGPALQPTLVTPSDFMDSANKILSSKPKSGGQGKLQSPQSANGAAIRKVPVSEFSFPVHDILAAGQTSTHTDGAPSPGGLSGFSASAKGHVSVSKDVDTNQAGKALIGLGIHGFKFDDDLLTVKDHAHLASTADSSSRHGSIMDSPVPENISSDILVADNHKIRVIDGVRYVPEREMLSWKKKFEKLVKESNRNVRLSPEAVASFTKSTNEPDAKTPLTANTTTFSTESKIALNTNPFSPREPVVSPNGVATAAPSETAMQFWPRTLDEALVAALRPSNTSGLFPPITPAAAPTPTLIDLAVPSVKTETTASTLAALDPPVIFANPFAKQAVRQLSTPPLPTLQTTDKVPTAPKQPAGVPIPSTSGSIVGDRKAFGKVSKHATKKAQPPMLTKKSTSQIPSWLVNHLKERNINDPLASMAIPGHQASAQNKTSSITTPAEQTAAEDSEESEL